MQVQAFEDPTSGRLFKSQQELDDYLDGQAKLTQQRERAEAAQQKLADLRNFLPTNLAHPEQFEALALALYQQYIACAYDLVALSSKRKPPRNRVEVLRVSASPLRVSQAQTNHRGFVENEPTICVNVKVVFNQDPDRLQHALVRFSPPDVLCPFVLHGGGSATHADEYVLSYSLHAQLSKLPLLAQTLKTYAMLVEAHEVHEHKVDEAWRAAMRADSECVQLHDHVRAAQIELRVAQEKLDKAALAADQRETALRNRVQAEMPFANADELAKGQSDFARTVQGNHYLVL